MRPQSFKCCLLLLLVLGGAALAEEQHISSQEMLALPPLEDAQRLPYGVDSLQFGDLRVPSGTGPFPVAIIVHGGCWLSFVDLHIMDRLAAALTKAGVATWNIEYRRVDNPGGGWPGTFRDVAHAADHLRVLASEHSLDLERVIVVGHSSGGHLALWLAARHTIGEESELFLSDPIRINGVASLGGVQDLRRILPQVEAVCGVNAVEKLLGGSPDAVPKRYRSASPVDMLPFGVQQLIISGAEDRAVPPADGVAYLKAAKAAGDRAEHLEIAGAGHFELIAPGWSDWNLIEEALLALLDPNKPER